MDGAEVLVKSLEKNGVDYIFGVPGDTHGKTAVSETFFFRELKKSKKINFIRTTHEQNAGFMADLYGRMSGKAGVCYTTLGPGATNISTAIATAQLDRSPVVCLSAQLPQTNWGQDTHQYIDMDAEFKHKTKRSLRIDNIDDIPTIIDYAFKKATQERPGAVHVQLLVDIFEEKKDSISQRLAGEKVELPLPRTEPFLKELKRAKFPLILVGASVIRQNATKELLAFMEKNRIYALSTFHGKGALPAQHPLYLGVMSRHLQTTTEILKEVDVLINIGYDYAEGITPKVWSTSQVKKIINIDSDSKTGGKFYNPDMEIICNIKEFFSQVNENNSNLEKFPERGIKKFGLDQLKFSINSYPINPLAFVKKLSGILSKDDVLIVDVGEHKQVMGLFYDAPSPKSVVFSNGHSTLGYAMPGAIGAKLALPRKNIIAVVGDGGFQMTSGEFITAVEHKIPIKVLILNDNAYGIIKYEQEKAFGSNYGVEYKNPDFVTLAKAYGGLGFRVTPETGLLPTLRRALASKKPTIVDIPITYRNKLW